MNETHDSRERRRFGKFSYLLGSLLALLIGAAFTGRFFKYSEQLAAR